MSEPPPHAVAMPPKAGVVHQKHEAKRTPQKPSVPKAQAKAQAGGVKKVLHMNSVSQEHSPGGTKTMNFTFGAAARRDAEAEQAAMLDDMLAAEDDEYKMGGNILETSPKV